MMDRLFTMPTKDLVQYLRIRYGVRWVYADQLAGTWRSRHSASSPCCGTGSRQC